MDNQQGTEAEKIKIQDYPLKYELTLVRQWVENHEWTQKAPYAINKGYALDKYNQPLAPWNRFAVSFSLAGSIVAMQSIHCETFKSEEFSAKLTEFIHNTVSAKAVFQDQDAKWIQIFVDKQILQYYTDKNTTSGILPMNNDYFNPKWFGEFYVINAWDCHVAETKSDVIDLLTRFEWCRVQFEQLKTEEGYETKAKNRP